MPNWCGNTLTLEHDDPEMIKRAETAFAEGKFLKELVPPPQEEWDYNWCVENWGTKWDVGSSDGINVVEENTIVFTLIAHGHLLLRRIVLWKNWALLLVLCTTNLVCVLLVSTRTAMMITMNIPV